MDFLGCTSYDATARTGGTEVFGFLGQRHFEQDTLTETERNQGRVAFQPSAFFSRFQGDIAYLLSDALGRLDGKTSHYAMCGDRSSLAGILPWNYEEYMGPIVKGIGGIVTC